MSADRQHVDRMALGLEGRERARRYARNAAGHKGTLEEWIVPFRETDNAWQSYAWLADACDVARLCAELNDRWKREGTR